MSRSPGQGCSRHTGVGEENEHESAEGLAHGSLGAKLEAQDVHGDQLQIVEGMSGIDAETGFVTIRGEVWNRSGRWIEATRVLVELFDPAGKPITVTGFLAETKREAGVDTRDSVVTTLHFVPPGEVAVFEYLRDPKNLGGARYGSHKLSAAAWAVQGSGPTVVVEGLRRVQNAGTWKVSGTLKNAGKVPCRSPKAVLGYYSAEGKVLHATYEEPQETFQKQLAPSRSVGFASEGLSLPPGVKDVKVWGDCTYQE